MYLVELILLLSYSQDSLISLSCGINTNNINAPRAHVGAV